MGSRGSTPEEEEKKKTRRRTMRKKGVCCGLTRGKHRNKSRGRTGRRKRRKTNNI